VIFRPPPYHCLFIAVDTATDLPRDGKSLAIIGGGVMAWPVCLCLWRDMARMVCSFDLCDVDACLPRIRGWQRSRHSSSQGSCGFYS
jgi:hypothetical protein